MPNQAWTDAIKEAYASVPDGIVLLHTVELSHPALSGETRYYIKAVQDYTLTLEDATQQLFRALPFDLSLPPAGADGVQNLNFSIDNIDRSVGDFLNKAKNNREPAKLVYRPYLSNDLTTPQMDPPLSLNLSDAKVTVTKVTAKATFADLLNKKHPLELYTRKRFPSLGG